MKLEAAIQIPMGVWPDPQGNPLLLLAEKLTLVYLGCWESSAKPANYACRLAFEHGWATRAMKVEYLPFETTTVGTSALYEVADSTYLREAEKWRRTVYPNWRDWDATVYRHFVVAGHDSYVEVIAKDFREDRIAIDEAREIMPRYYREFVAELPDDSI